MILEFNKYGHNARVTVSDVDGDVLIGLSTYPTHAQMAVPLDVAIKLADEIIAIARKQIKEAA